MKFHLILILFLVGNAVSLEAQANKDSLWNVWNDQSAPDTNRLKAIQALTWPMLNINLDSAYLLAKMQLDFAREKKQRKWEARALYNIGAQYYLKSEYSQAISYYNQSLEIRKEIKDLKGEAAIYGNLGLIYGDQGNLLKDLQYQLKSLAINQVLNDTDNLTSNYANLASIYLKQDDSTNALMYFNKALDMYRAEDNRRHIGLIYNNMGNMYREYKSFEKAKWYLFESLRLRTELQDYLGMAISYINIGTLFISMKDFEKGEEYTRKSIEYFNKIKDEGSLSHVYYNLGDIARRQGKYKEALNYCTKSLDIARRTKKVEIEAADCSCLYRSHKELGNYKLAIDFFEEYVALDDSLKKEDLKLEMSRLDFEKEVLTDTLSREAEKQELNSAHQLELTRKTRVTNIILIACLGLLFLASLFLWRMLVFQRNSEKLQSKTTELGKQQLVNEISLLKTQVNPHFLFNSLSILSSLVHVDPDLSEKFIDQLSKSYRYILEQKDQALVTLRTELNFIEAYAFLLKIRFENKFRLDIHLPEEILDKYKIAPLTLQLLVENAVKHNRMSLAEPLVVDVSLNDENMLVVKNKLQPRATEYKSTGVGLENIMNRYALVTNKKVFVGEVDDHFVVKIPMLTEQVALGSKV